MADEPVSLNGRVSQRLTGVRISNADEFGAALVDVARMVIDHDRMQLTQPLVPPATVGSWSWALQQLEAGQRVARKGWNGKGMWLVLVPGDAWGESGLPECARGLRYLPWIGMKTADGGFVPWLCSQTDALKHDWVIVP